MAIDLSEEQIWALPLVEVEALCRQHDIRQKKGEFDADELAALRSLVSPGKGTTLPQGPMGGDDRAFPNVGKAAGDHIVENRVTRTGLHLLKILRLGIQGEETLYLEQVAARPGAKQVRWMRWADSSGGQAHFYLMVFWREG